MSIELTADEYKVHAQEKISTGDYESATVDVSVSGSVEGIHSLDRETRKTLRAHLLTVERMLQENAERYAENRIREDGHENWGVASDE